jgi:hypothetical protein
MTNKLHRLLDTPALVIAMAVDLALVGISLIVIATGVIERIGMALLALVVVLFAVRAWVKGGRMGKILWACFALSAFFLDLSFVLVVTDVQSTATVDKELERLTARQDAAEAQVAALQQQYDAAVSRATMDQLADQIKIAEQKGEAYRRDRQERLGRVEAGETKPITSAALSTAIFDAASSGRPGRITFLVLFALIFAGLQLTMITAAGASFAEKIEHPEPVDTQPVAHRRRFATDDVSRWVSVTWNYVRNGRSADAPVSRASFEKIAKGRFSMQLWDDLMARAVDLGLIVGGKIIEKDTRTACEKLQEK